MNKTKIEKLKLEVYEEKLENGLEIYVIPKNNCNNIYATFSTRYGSNNDEFVPLNEKKNEIISTGNCAFSRTQNV